MPIAFSFLSMFTHFSHRTYYPSRRPSRSLQWPFILCSPYFQREPFLLSSVLLDEPSFQNLQFH